MLTLTLWWPKKNSGELTDKHRRCSWPSSLYSCQVCVCVCVEGIVDILLDDGASVNVRNRKNQLPNQLTHNMNILNKLSAALATSTAHSSTVKVGFHYPSSRAENSARELGLPNQLTHNMNILNKLSAALATSTAHSSTVSKWVWYGIVGFNVPIDTL